MERTVSRSSTILQNRYHQHAFAICKHIEELRYTVNLKQHLLEEIEKCKRLS
jgi:hypothetical protein